MDPEKLAELNPLKIVAGLVVMGGIMGFGLLMSQVTGPSAIEMHDAQLRQAKMEFTMERQRVVDKAMWEANSNLTADDIGRAMSYGN